MTKRKLFLTAILTIVFAVTCAMFAACGGDKEPEAKLRQITWTYESDKVTVTADGYETLPAELDEGTVVNFTVTPKIDGWEANATGSGVKANGNGYQLTVGSRDVTVKITANKILNALEVKVLKEVNYFEDNKVDVSSIEVTAKFATGDEVVTDYTIQYANGDAFSEGDTSFTVNYGGKSQTIEVAEVKAPQDFGDASLDVDEDGNPVMVVTGQYNVEGNDTAAAIADIESFFKECLERTTWAQKQYEAKATFDEDGVHFTLRLTIKEWTATPTGHHYYFRYAKGGQVKDGQNLSCGVSNATCAPDANNDLPGSDWYGDPLTNKDGVSFYIGKCENWQGCVMIVAKDDSAPQFTNASLEVINNKPYFVFNGTGKPTQETLLNKYIIHLDIEDINNGNAKLGDNYVDENAIVDETRIIIEIDEENGTFKVCLLLEGDGVVDGAAFFAHMGSQGSDGYYPNVSFKADDTQKTITCNGFTFTFVAAADLGLTESWQANILYISVTAA